MVLSNTTNSENQRNASLRSSNTSGIMGVNFRKGKGKIKDKWCARINDGNRRVHLGYFHSFFDACCARKSAENKYNYHPNHGGS